MRPNRVYPDTSVFGGVFDDEFREISKLFFREVSTRRHVLWLSGVTARELLSAPIEVREFVAGLPEECLRQLPFTEEMAALRDAYLAARVVSRRWSDDAAHVAAATVARADLVVSWNFRHIVKWDRIRAFNSVNLSLGYPLMTILSLGRSWQNEQQAQDL